MVFLLFLHVFLLGGVSCTLRGSSYSDIRVICSSVGKGTGRIGERGIRGKGNEGEEGEKKSEKQNEGGGLSVHSEAP